MNDSDKAVLSKMSLRKLLHRDHFAHATLVVDKEFREYDDHGTNRKGRTVRAGTRVLITVYSRLGHLCIRDTDINRLEHGYVAGALPEELKDFVAKWKPEPGFEELWAKLEEIEAKQGVAAATEAAYVEADAERKREYDAAVQALQVTASRRIRKKV